MLTVIVLLWLAFFLVCYVGWLLKNFDGWAKDEQRGPNNLITCNKCGRLFHGRQSHRCRSV